MRRLLLLVALACACGKSKQGGVEANIEFSGFRPACIEVVVSDVADATRTASTTVVVTQPRLYTVGIGPGAGWSSTWSVTVLGHEGDCTGAVVARDEEPRVEVVPGTVKIVSFLLSAVDGDTDGWVTDCDDMDPMRSPGVPESCLDGIDNDCDGLADCADPGCATKSCDDRNGCTSGDTCTGTTCSGTTLSCGSSPLACRSNPGACVADAGCAWALAAVGTPCDGGLCNNSGACAPADVELNCADGVDDPSDTDTLADCADDDCYLAAASCDGGLCVVGATCQMNRTCTGAPKPCGAPGTCRDAGTCNPLDGACVFPPSPPGSACTDGNACTDESCNGSGTCAATAKVCPAGGPCQSPGCDAGGCFLAPLSGVACSDDAGCTFADVCTSGVCSGTTYSCANPPVCREPGTCQGDGGCVFVTASNGTPCDGGWGRCSSGGCMQLPASPFPYAPANFVPALYAPAGAVDINCAMTLDSTDGGASSWCGNPAPAIYTVVMDGGSTALLIAAQSLEVSSAGTMRLIGSRPVIIAVYSTGETLIDGALLANTETPTIRGAGSRGTTTCGTQAGGPSTSADHSGGGAGYATPGAPGITASGGAPGDAGPSSPVPLLGGCPGGDTSGGVQGGNGGGALQVSVAGELRVAAGTLSVSGGGGRGGPSSGGTPNGGAGAGSGGVLLLEGNTLTLTSSAHLTANGGAGGEGGDNNENGSAGGNGSTSGDGFATSGDSANNGGNGGRGGTRNGPPQSGIAASSNGGGGGAVGRIFVHGHTACGVSIPANQLSPRYQVIGSACPASP